MLYQMKLQDEAFGRMQQGVKRLELRLCDEKRRLLSLGDEIEFVRMSDPADRIRVKIIGLLRYETFAELIEDLPAEFLGYEETEKDYLKTSMYEYYTPEDEALYGVLGIRIRLLEEGK